MALVLGVIASLIDWISIFNVIGSTSTTFTSAPKYLTTSAVAVNVRLGTITSSPLEIPNASNAKCKPDVAELTAIASTPNPIKSLKLDSKIFILLITLK